MAFSRSLLSTDVKVADSDGPNLLNEVFRNIGNRTNRLLHYIYSCFSARGKHANLQKSLKFKETFMLLSISLPRLMRKVKLTMMMTMIETE